MYLWLSYPRLHCSSHKVLGLPSFLAFGSSEISADDLECLLRSLLRVTERSPVSSLPWYSENTKNSIHLGHAPLQAEVEWFYEDLQDLLELTPQKGILFIIGDWNTKLGSQETPR